MRSCHAQSELLPCCTALSSKPKCPVTRRKTLDQSSLWFIDATSLVSRASFKPQGRLGTLNSKCQQSLGRTDGILSEPNRLSARFPNQLQQRSVIVHHKATSNKCCHGKKPQRYTDTHPSNESEDVSVLQSGQYEFEITHTTTTYQHRVASPNTRSRKTQDCHHCLLQWTT
jgi:hypothetical protein